MEDRGELTSSSRMSRLGCYFRAFMVLVVALDAVFMGLETDRELKAAYSALFEGADVFYLVVFILEFMVKVYTEPCGFWGSGANICNTGFLLLSLISRADGSYWVFRILRAFRILRIVFIIPSIQDLVLILFQGLKTAAYVTAMIFFILLVFAVAGVQHFGTADPENWGDMGVALLSTLSVVTISGWLEHQDRLHSLGIAYSELFFIILILIGNFMFLNMFTGLVMQTSKQIKMQKMEEEDLQKKRMQRKRKEQLLQSPAEYFHQLRLKYQQSDSADFLEPKEVCTSLTWINLYLTTLEKQEEDMRKLKQISDDALRIQRELLELDLEEQRGRAARNVPAGSKPGLQKRKAKSAWRLVMAAKKFAKQHRSKRH
ncbi:cation channel sperm-associated protein 3-like [Salminus brasiliensis]|uniref:cation channel sperm-associated protein 3-like n=1 Tax=Salminus brasiliensis TaxID=930266 RepID=UPI003B82D757